ncbi:5-formyltetrahydrofolate cyclo-ligase [Paraburkholderia sp. B3]|uniref:5-formyltetrahydrofolate cyclo-ligase n=1 Tax=Paraburkholderia sp. B3 TaxID=3134791 RepID=UPI0039824A4D
MEHEVSPSIARNPRAQSKKTWRATLAATRLEAASDVALSAALEQRLGLLVERLAPRSIGFYWPLRGEFDARTWIAAWLRDGSSRSAALPGIPERHAPLAFYAWIPEALLREGHHGIPEPASQERVVPELLLVPCVGFDAQGYRLGYGGGYYDRTLAAWPGERLPITVGVAWEACRIDEGVPEREAHDLPLDAIVTDAATHLTPRLDSRLGAP